VPRYVLYTQGFLLVAVGLFCFALGNLSARPDPRRVAASGRAESVELSGTVRFESTHGQWLPDADAAVLAVPIARQPGVGERPSAVGLRPGDPQPHVHHESLRVIRLLGGAYTRTDAGGRFRLRLTGGESYFVLVLSAHAKRDADVDLRKADLAQIGRYVLPVTELLGDRRYVWREIQLPADDVLTIDFQRTGDEALRASVAIP
jgi:hypothetical protein